MLPQVFVEPSPVPTIGQRCSPGGHTAGYPQGGPASDRSRPWRQCEASQQHDPGQGPHRSLKILLFHRMCAVSSYGVGIPISWYRRAVRVELSWEWIDSILNVF